MNGPRLSTVNKVSELYYFTWNKNIIARICPRTPEYLENLFVHGYN